jgi:Holliday junction resolvase RusA-like endonuclease
MSSDILSLDISGVPAPQGSKRVINGRLIEASGDKLKRWRRAIADECQRQSGLWHLSSQAIEIEVVFYLERPKTVKPSKRWAPTVPPDLDKLLRALLDGIGQSGVIWGDDSQVVRITAWKSYADNRYPGAEVRIWEI